MATPGKLPVGPTRDLLAKLSEARRGDTWVGTDLLQQRTGVAHSVLRRRLAVLMARGWIEGRPIAGYAMSEYRATEAGQGKL